MVLQFDWVAMVIVAVIGSGSSGRGGAPGCGTIIIRGTWKLTEERSV